MASETQRKIPGLTQNGYGICFCFFCYSLLICCYNLKNCTHTHTPTVMCIVGPCRLAPPVTLAPVAWHLSPGTTTLAWHLSPGTCSLAPVAWHLSPGTLQSQTPLLPTATVKNSLDMKTNPLLIMSCETIIPPARNTFRPFSFFAQHLLG